MPDNVLNENRFLAYMQTEVMKLFEDCLSKLKEYVEDEMPEAEFPDDWKSKVVKDLKLGNLVLTADMGQVDIGLFYETIWEMTRARVMEKGTDGVPWHRPGATAWNDELTGWHKASQKAAYAIPGFAHKGEKFWENALRRLESYFEIRKKALEDSLDFSQLLR